MKQTLRITPADPAGNKTLLIEGDVPPERYASLAAELLARPDCDAEQAGYILPSGRLHMSGGEFCGNACRAYGLLLAQRQGLSAGDLMIEISGASAPVRVSVDPETGTAFADMPLPEALGVYLLPQPYGMRPIVEFEGIWHIIMASGAFSEESFPEIRDAVYSRVRPEALGVMYLAKGHRSMVPMVYVDGPGTVYRESSCGSGTAAVAAWMADCTGEDISLTMAAPGGPLTAEATLGADGRLARIRIGGLVTLGETFDLEAEI